MQVLPDKITHYCCDCNKHLEAVPSACSAHNVRRVGDGGDGLFWWIYGEFGTYKTRFLATLPKPLELHDFDLGTRSIQSEIQSGGITIKHYDTEDAASYDEAVTNLANFDYRKYRSLAIDSGSELEKLAFTKTKGLRNAEFMEIYDYNPAGERFGKMVRQLRWFKLAYGVQVVITSNEEIDKEYAKGGAFVPNPAGKGLVAQEPTSIKGLPDLAGKWAKKSARLADVILHSRYVNNMPAFCANREAVGGGSAMWEVKDRTGCLERLPACEWGMNNFGRPGKYGNGICPPDWNVLWKAIQNGRT